MLQALPPPPIQALQAVPEMPLLPGSDSMLLGVFQWTLAHSPSLQEVVRKLPGADRKARYRLVPSLDANYGSLHVRAMADIYDIDIEVPVLGWTRCGDALEPWIASAFFLALDAASKGKYLETNNPQHYRFVDETRKGAFAFQAKVRQELAASDPERLKYLPNGLMLYAYGFKEGIYPGSESKKLPTLNEVPKRRPLPKGVH